jgi:hypothetical protein
MEPKRHTVSDRLVPQQLLALVSFALCLTFAVSRFSGSVVEVLHASPSSQLDLRNDFRTWQRYSWQSEAFAFTPKVLESDRTTIDGDPLDCAWRHEQIRLYDNQIGTQGQIPALQKSDDALRSWLVDRNARRRRVLFYSALHQYHTFMDRYWFQMLYDASIYSKWETILWGPGYVECRARYCR